MHKIIPAIFVIAFLFKPMASFADIHSRYCEDRCWKGSVAAKCAAFFPLCSKVRRIYDTALPQLTLEGNLLVYSLFSGDLSIWLDGSYVFDTGHSYGYQTHGTFLNLVPISLGAKYLYSFSSCLDGYLGVGPSYNFLNIHDRSPYVHRRTSVNNAGVIVKSGLVYHFQKSFYLEGFFNYSFTRFSFPKFESDPYVERNNIDFSSLQAGLGLGLKF